jgi:hypothetical protein
VEALGRALRGRGGVRGSDARRRSRGGRGTPSPSCRHRVARSAVAERRPRDSSSGVPAVVERRQRGFSSGVPGGARDAGSSVKPHAPLSAQT